MAKIDNQSGLTLGTNLFLHIQEVEATDIAVDATNHELNKTAGDFEASSSVGGIEGSGFIVGDTITVDSENNGFVATIDAVTALQIQYTVVSGTEVTEAAGATIDVQRTTKFVEYQEAGGLSFVDGVEGTALHSKMQTLWKDSDLDKYDPLSGSIEPRAKSLYFLNFWDFFNTDTQKAHRGGAVQLQETKASSIDKIYGHATAPATVDDTDQWRYGPRDAAAGTPFTAAVTTGFMDELILIFDSANSIDNRGDWIFTVAEPGKTIATQTRTLQYAETVAVTVTNAIDPILGDASGPFVDDSTISGGGIYANITVTKNRDIALCHLNTGVGGNNTITAVGANITVTGMAGGDATNHAEGTIALSGLPADGDTITINDGTNPAVVFEFESGGGVTGGNTAVTIGADEAITLTSLKNAISDSVLLISSDQGVHVNSVEGTNHTFGYNIEYDNQDYVTVHTKLNWLARQTTNINEDVNGPVLIGNKTPAISTFIGDTQTIDGFPLNFLSTNQNDIVMLDQCDEVRKFDTVGSYTIVIPESFANAVPAPQISVYVADTHGSTLAAIVTNAAAVSQQDIVLSAAETAISYAYSTFSGGGHTPNTPLDIAIAYNQPGVAEAEVFFGNTIQANTTQRFQLAPSVDPSYVP